MTRFVLLKHNHPFLHWDLMLEVEESLWTWRLDRPPRYHDTQFAERIADHRKIYLDYEGPISGGRGEVRREVSGTLEWLLQEETKLMGYLKSNHLEGVVTMERLSDNNMQWSIYLIPGRASTESP
ncbi:MAG: hypothetical protein EBV06_05895 [Planctomycetia bacterium]|nr:hypothetical protein [Planctomycetia bacterium]